MRVISLGLLATMAVLALGCAHPKGATIQEKRDFVQEMEESTLTELYQRMPETRDKLVNAAGYGVFSNIGTGFLIGGAGNGYGLVVDNQTGEETYMRMVRATAGLGVGIKDFRAVFVFHDRETMRRFIENGWEFGSEADVVAKGSDKGGAAGAVGTVNPGLDIYQFTESGIYLRAAVAGTKYWRDKKLNEGS